MGRVKSFRNFAVSGTPLLLALVMAFLAFAPAGVANAQSDTSLAGEYTVSITREDVPTDLPDGFSFIGQWRIAFNEDGTYFAERLDVGLLIEGTWVASNTSVTITDENGLLSCSNPSAAAISPGDIAVGEYDWVKTGAQLTLVTAEDGCRGRQLLLGTRPMDAYVACRTTPEMVAAMTTDATPVAVDETATEAPDSVLDVLRPDSTPSAAAVETSEGELSEIEAGVDDLLQQMTACWTTGKPNLWLPLLTPEFRISLSADPAELEATLRAAMGSPIIWERAGDVEVESGGSVSAIVKTTTGPEEDFLRLVFTPGDDGWRWNG